MAKHKMRIVSKNDTPTMRPGDGKTTSVSCGAQAMADNTHPSAEEGLRLFKAFFEVSDPQRRQALIEQAERAARG